MYEDSSKTTDSLPPLSWKQKLLYGGAAALTTAGVAGVVAAYAKRGPGHREYYDANGFPVVDVHMTPKQQAYANYLWNLPVGEGEYVAYEDFDYP